MQNAKCKMQNAKCKMQNAKCKMQNAKCKKWEFGEISDCRIYCTHSFYALAARLLPMLSPTRFFANQPAARK
ncbi:MAG: hypothetical protein ACI9XK_001321 [Granulosicoccus sp.]|jgi:hypothetical protein